MKEISSYKVLEKLGQSAHAEVFKVMDTDDPDHLLVLKRVRPELCSEDLFFFLFQQVERLKHIHIPGVINSTLCKKEGKTIFLIRDFIDGINVGAWRRDRTDVPLPLFFKFACSLTDLLSKLHKKNVIHGGIKPANILVDPATLDVFLIDLVRIMDVNEIHRFINDRRSLSVFTHISPEQTGHVDHPVGQTTDLYSLGGLFYELLTGNAPFLSDDPLELIHSLLAEDPRPLHQLDPEVPETISGIIAKLMQKQPADRYQTCGGLLDDLKKSQDLYLEKGEIPVFEPGLTDSRPHRLNSPVPLIGGEHAGQEAQRITSPLDQMLDRFPDSVGTLRGMSWIISSFRSMTTDLSIIADQLWETIRMSKERGYFIEAALGYFLLLYVQLFQGNDLSLIERTARLALEHCQKHGLSLFDDFLSGLNDGWVIPMGGKSTRSDLTRNASEPKGEESPGILTVYPLFKAWALYYLGDYEQADVEFRRTRPPSGDFEGSVPDQQWQTGLVLNSLRLINKEKDETRKQGILAEMGPVIAKIEAWSRLELPLKPYMALIRAEQMGASGEFRETRNLYLDAIDAAHEKGYTLLEGQVHELLGELLSSKGHAQAEYHLKAAANLFYECRAEVKLASLKNTYPACFPAGDDASDLPPLGDRLDVEYLMRAAGTISRELDAEALLKTFMIFLMERMGAKNGYGLFEKDGELFLRIQGTKRETIQVVPTKISFRDVKGISRGIVRHVRRTKETVVLDNALEEGPFISDMDVQQQKLRSILCLPIMERQELTGIIYLENRLIQGVFTKEHIRFSKLLVSQAAISLENSRLVNDMKKTTQALRESEKMLERSRDFSGVVIWSREIPGNRWRYSGNSASLLGHPVRDLATAKDVLNTIHPMDRARVDRITRECIRTGRNYDIDFRTIHRNGTEHWIRLRGGAISNAEGRTVRLGGMIMDITDQKMAELALKKAHDELEKTVEARTRKLREANSALEAFNYTVSHDLRAPLRHIGIFAGILQEDFGPDMKEGANRYVTKIRTAAKRLDALITALLRLSRISSKPMIYREINMNGLAKQLIESFKAENPGREVKIILGDLAPARGEPALIRNALSNLLENAFKYTRLREKTRIEVGCKREGTNPPVYFVSDNGVGFDMKYKNKLFGIFQRLHSEKDFEGIGIGLAGAKRIINKHGGEIRAEAEPDKGATFYFTLYEEESN